MFNLPAEPDKKVTPLTESDEALAKLMRAETRLENDEDRLSREVAAAHNDARAAMQLGNKLAVSMPGLFLFIAKYS